MDLWGSLNRQLDTSNRALRNALGVEDHEIRTQLFIQMVCDAEPITFSLRELGRFGTKTGSASDAIAWRVTSGQRLNAW
jgi:hypothetical protein